MVDLRQLAITTAVAVLFSLFIILAVDAFYPEPKYNDFCSDIPERYIGKPIPVESCDYTYNEGYYQCLDDGGTPRFKQNETDNCLIFDQCDFCNKDFNEARETYNRDFFLIVAPIGIAAIIFGIYWAIEFIGTGFMFGGIILLFFSTIRYFSELDRYLKVVVIFIELLIVIWIGYKKLHKTSSKRRKK